MRAKMPSCRPPSCKPAMPSMKPKKTTTATNKQTAKAKLAQDRARQLGRS